MRLRVSLSAHTLSPAPWRVPCVSALGLGAGLHAPSNCRRMHLQPHDNLASSPEQFSHSSAGLRSRAHSSAGEPSPSPCSVPAFLFSFLLFQLQSSKDLKVN